MAAVGESPRPQVLNAATADMYKKLFAEEMVSCEGDQGAAAAKALVRLKEMTAAAAPTPPSPTLAPEAVPVPADQNGSLGAGDGETGGQSPANESAAAMRERRLRALEQQQNQNKALIEAQKVSMSTFKNKESTLLSGIKTGAALKASQPTGASSGSPSTQPASSPVTEIPTPMTGVVGPDGSAADIREQRLRALERQNSANSQASQGTSFKKRDWETAGMSASADGSQPAVDKERSSESASVPAVSAEQSIVDEEESSYNGPMITTMEGGVLVRRPAPKEDGSVPAPAATGVAETHDGGVMEDEEAQDPAVLEAIQLSLQEESEVPEREKKPAEEPKVPTGEDLSADDLESIARRLEGGGPAKAGDAAAAMHGLQEAAKKIRRLEAAATHFAQTLRLVQMVVAQSGIPPPMMGSEADDQENGGGGGGMSANPFARMAQQQEEKPKSYMVKRGDAETHPMMSPEPARAPLRLVSSSGMTGSSQSPTSASGTPLGASSLASGPTLSREEMEQQKRDRLARLEQQQEKALKEKEKADEKERARNAISGKRSEIGL